MCKFFSAVLVAALASGVSLGFAADGKPERRTLGAENSAVETSTIQTSLDGQEKLVAIGQFLDEPELTFIITHGFGGTTFGDRFYRLGAAIKLHVPGSNVLIVDWSRESQAEQLGLPAPWKVANRIDAVAERAGVNLLHLNLNLGSTILIGESFGNWVNFRIAERLGGVYGMLAFNPASELGGYLPPDLKQVSASSWAFHTVSPFDTHQDIADRSLHLETGDRKDPTTQHTFGVVWLCERVDQGDLAWLKLRRHLPKAEPGHYDAVVNFRGQLLAQQPPLQASLATSEIASTRQVSQRQSPDNTNAAQ